MVSLVKRVKLKPTTLDDDRHGRLLHYGPYLRKGSVAAVIPAAVLD